MSRFYLRLTLIPILLFTTALILIHAQPYDDHELRELLLPEGCPAPCLMGIKPGVTTMDEAVTILQANPWIEHIERTTDNYSDQIKWTWNDQISKWIIPASEGQIQPIQNSERRLVGTIAIYGFLQLGDAYVLLGAPDTEKLEFSGYSIGEIYAYIAYKALYNKEKISLYFDQACHTGYPGTGSAQVAGVPFTAPVAILIDMRSYMPFSEEVLPKHSPIHNRPACDR